jgi:dipeptidyl aminopeptidase/acylaminoacyl peptidase
MKKSPVRISDLYKMKFLREISLSPDGKKICYTVEWMDRKENKYFQNLHVVDEQNEIHHYLRGKKHIHQPKWSPDGRSIAMIITEKEKSNIWVIPSRGGEAYQVTNAEGTFGMFRWTPDSRWIVCEFTRKDIDKERIPDKNKPPLFYHITNAWYKLDNAGMLPQDRSHIWKVNAKTGAMKQLTFGKNGDADPSISPDGKKIVFVSNRQKKFEERFLYTDILTIGIDGKNERTVKTPAGPKGNPVFSPDNRHIAYVGNEKPESFLYELAFIYIMPSAGGRPTNLTAKLDLDIGDSVIDDCVGHSSSTLMFSRDGRKLFFQTTRNGSNSVYRIEIASRKTEKFIGGKERIYAYDHDGRKTFALAISNSRDPGSLFKWQNGSLVKTAETNKDYLRSRRIAEPLELNFKGYAGRPIQGWVMLPPGFSSKKRYPLLVEVHGGPHMAYGYSFFHEFQALAANGYIVFYSNPHGSVGYGEKFAKALDLRWGIPDSVDILNAIRLLRKKFPIDPRRMAVMGGSYGGFMTNWLIGRTDIFRAAVTMRSVVNMISFPANDFGFMIPKEFKRTLWEKGGLEWFWNMSPLKYAPRIKTPLLIIHSEQDLRCPISQGEELYAALKYLKKDVEFARFPGESHELSRHGSPRRREKRLELMLDFLDRHLKSEKADKR